MSAHIYIYRSCFSFSRIKGSIKDRDDGEGGEGGGELSSESIFEFFFHFLKWEEKGNCEPKFCYPMCQP